MKYYQVTFHIINIKKMALFNIDWYRKEERSPVDDITFIYWCLHTTLLGLRKDNVFQTEWLFRCKEFKKIYQKLILRILSALVCSKLEA